jgi:hypothetical protein
MEFFLIYVGGLGDKSEDGLSDMFVEDIKSRCNFDFDLVLVFVSNISRPLNLSESFYRAYPNVELLMVSSSSPLISHSFISRPDQSSISYIAFSKGCSPGVGFSDSSAESEIGKIAVDASMLSAGREGEVPLQTIIFPTSGFEENMLHGLRELTGLGVRILGGTCSSFNSSAGYLFYRNKVHYHGVLALSFYECANHVFTSAQSGFVPGPFSGTITKASKRNIFEINSRRALDTLTEWKDQLAKTDAALSGKNSCSPVSTVHDKSSSIPLFTLLQVESVDQDIGSFQVLKNVNEGDTIVQMVGFDGCQISSIPSQVRNLIERERISLSDIKLCLVIAGSGLAEIQKTGSLKNFTGMNNELKEVLSGAPFSIFLSHGEQVQAGDEVFHNNLMTSIILFVQSI